MAEPSGKSIHEISFSDKNHARSNVELCRFISDGVVTPEKLESELVKEDALKRLCLNIRYYEKEPEDEASHVDFPQLRDVDESDLNDNKKFDTEIIVKFFLNERLHIFYLLSLILHTAADSSNTYYKVARSVFAKISDFFENVLKSCEKLIDVDVPSHLHGVYRVLWADNYVEEQALLLQVVVCYFRAYDLPSSNYANHLMKLCQSCQFGGHSLIYTMLSASGRETVKCVNALWNLVVSHLLQLPLLTQAMLTHDAFPSLVLGGVDDLLDLDERWFSTLGGMDEQGPALVIWAVSLCLSYQILESNPHRQTDNKLRVQLEQLKNRLLKRLNTALRMNAFRTMTSMIRTIDANLLLGPAATVARENMIKEVLYSLCLSNISNVLSRVSEIHSKHLLPLYDLLLSGNPVLTLTMWDEITSCIANSTELKMFPTFAYAYRRSYSALPIESARDTDQLGEFACLLSLLRAMSGSAECAQRAESTLNELVDSHDGLARLKNVYIERIRCITVAQTRPLQGDWSFVRTFTTFWQKFCSAMSLSVDIEIAECCLRLLLFIREMGSDGLDTVDSLAELISACLALLKDAVLDEKLVQLFLRYSLATLIPKVMRIADVPSGRFTALNGLLGLIASIIEACEQRALPAEAQYEEFLSRSLDFIVNDVFTGFDTWRYRDRLARWRIGEEVLLLIYKLLQFASPSAMEEPANKQTVVTGRALLVRLGDRIALHLLSSPALQMTVLKPIVVERMFLESGHPQSFKGRVANLNRAAFHVLEMILKLRFDWATRVDGNGQAVCDESLFDTFFASGADTSRMLKTLLSYMELFDHSWHILVISFLTHLSNLSGLLPERFGGSSSLAGYLGSELLETLRKRCSRLLEKTHPSIATCVIDLLCSSLRYQQGLAEHLFGLISKQTDISEDSVWNPMKRLLQDCNEPIALEMLLRVLVTLWDSACDFRNMAAICRLLLQRWSSFWPCVCKPLLFPPQQQRQFNTEQKQALLKAQAAACRILTCELRFSEGSSESVRSSGMMDQLINTDVTLGWLECLDAQSGVWKCPWRSLDARTSTALGLFLTNWSMLLETVLLYCTRVFVDASLAAPHALKLTALLHCEELPLLFAKVLYPSIEAAPPRALTQLVVQDMVSVLMPVVYASIKHSVVLDVNGLLDSLTESLAQHERAFAVLTERNLEQELRCEIVEKLLSTCVLLLCSAPTCAFADRTLRVATRFLTRPSAPSLPEQLALTALLPFLIERVPTPHNYIESLQQKGTPLHADAKSSMQVMLGWLLDGDDRARVRSVLQVCVCIACKPHGAQLLVQEGLLVCLNNSWLRNTELSVHDDTGRRSEKHEIWCLVLDCLVAMLRSFGDEISMDLSSATETESALLPASVEVHGMMLRQLSEFLVVFRRQICIGLRSSSASARLELSFGSLEEMEVLCSLLYEVCRLPSRWRTVPEALLAEHKQLVRFVAVTYSKLVADAPRLELSASTRQSVPRAEVALPLPVHQHQHDVVAAQMRQQQQQQQMVASDSVFLKRIELCVCRMLCSAFSFLLLFTPDLSEATPLQFRALFSVEINYRSVSDDLYRHQPPPLTFLVELIDYCHAALSTDVKKTAGLDDKAREFVESNAGEFEAAQRLLIEQALYMLVAHMQLFLVPSMPLPLMRDYVDLLSRLRLLVSKELRAQQDVGKALQTREQQQQQQEQDAFLNEVVLQPMQTLEKRLNEHLEAANERS